MLNSKRFFFKPPLGPTQHNLSRYLHEYGWRVCRFNWQARFGDSNLQFETQATQQLEFKHLLAELVAEHCLHVMPVTYRINDNNWPQVLQEIADKYYLNNNQYLNEVHDLIWILKPSLLNNGQGIKIISCLSSLEEHFLKRERMGGEYVLQQYIHEPHLLKPAGVGYKYSIRMFVIITNDRGNYLYPQGYFNVARNPFTYNNFSNLSSHLTNEHLGDELNVIQIPSDRFDFFNSIYPEIKKIVTSVINAMIYMHPNSFIFKKPRAFAIFGFDFMLDKSQRVWLLEANHGPCFPFSDEHPLQRYLYAKFWRDFIERFIQPIISKSTDLKEETFQLL